VTPKSKLREFLQPARRAPQSFPDPACARGARRNAGSEVRRLGGPTPLDAAFQRASRSSACAARRLPKRALPRIVSSARKARAGGHRRERFVPRVSGSSRVRDGPGAAYARWQRDRTTSPGAIVAAQKFRESIHCSEDNLAQDSFRPRGAETPYFGIGGRVDISPTSVFAEATRTRQPMSRGTVLPPGSRTTLEADVEAREESFL